MKRKNCYTHGFKLFNKRYLLDLDRLIYVIVMSILVILFIVGYIYVSNAEYQTLIQYQ